MGGIRILLQLLIYKVIPPNSLIQFLRKVCNLKILWFWFYCIKVERLFYLLNFLRLGPNVPCTILSSALCSPHRGGPMRGRDFSFARETKQNLFDWNEGILFCFWVQPKLTHRHGVVVCTCCYKSVQALHVWCKRLLS